MSLSAPFNRSLYTMDMITVWWCSTRNI